MQIIVIIGQLESSQVIFNMLITQYKTNILFSVGSNWI